MREKMGAPGGALGPKALGPSFMHQDACWGGCSPAWVGNSSGLAPHKPTWDIREVFPAGAGAPGPSHPPRELDPSGRAH